jgi:hypothetical protein
MKVLQAPRWVRRGMTIHGKNSNNNNNRIANNRKSAQVDKRTSEAHQHNGVDWYSSIKPQKEKDNSPHPPYIPTSQVTNSLSPQSRASSHSSIRILYQSLTQISNSHSHPTNERYDLTSLSLCPLTYPALTDVSSINPSLTPPPHLQHNQVHQKRKGIDY